MGTFRNDVPRGEGLITADMMQTNQTLSLQQEVVQNVEKRKRVLGCFFSKVLNYFLEFKVLLLCFCCYSSKTCRLSLVTYYAEMCYGYYIDTKPSHNVCLKKIKHVLRERTII